MAVSGGELMGDAVAAAEDDRDFELSTRHVADVGGVVHELVEADEGEAPAHVLDNGAEAAHGSADAQAGKASFADRSVEDSARAEFGQHAFADFVGAVVFAHFLAHEKDGLIALHFLGHGGSEGFS
jgi:hypothetical protein